MNQTAPFPGALTGAEAVGLDDIPAIAIVLMADGEAQANQAFFDTPGVAEDGVISSAVPWELCQQLCEVRDNQRSSSQVCFSANPAVEMRVLSWKTHAHDASTLFLLQEISRPTETIGSSAGSVDVNEERNARSVAEELLNSLPLPVFVHDKGKLLFANPALAILGGFPDVDSLLSAGINGFEFFLEKDKIRELGERRTRGEDTPTAYETEIVTLDGRECIVEINANIMSWYGRNVVIGSITDVTQTRLAVEKLERSEARFRDYTSTAANWFWETDTQDRFVQLSDGVEEITGTPVKDVIGLSRNEVFSLCNGEYIDDPALITTALTNQEPFRDFKYALTVPSGRRLSFAISGVPIVDSDGVFNGYRGTSRDITEERELQEAISYAASHDDLTGLLNRRELVTRVEAAIDFACGRGNEDVSGSYDFLCLIDLDGLKIINDTVGHGFGDELLVQCATLLKQGVRDGDVVSRLGGDEFGILLRRISKEEAVLTIERLLKQVSQYKFHRHSHTFNVGFSAGLICIDGRVASTEDLFAFADLSCYTAKERGKGQVCVYETSNDVVAQRRVEMHTASRIEAAIENNMLVVHAQPIVSLKSDVYAPDRYELLVRMLNHDGSLVPPGAFIGAAERYNLAPNIDRFVMRHAFIQIAPFLARGDLRVPSITLNLSGETLGDPSFAQFVIEQFQEFPSVEPRLVCFEVTETAAIRNLDVATDFIQQMRRLGCSFALDDFGTGLSSFSYLKDLDVDLLKIDGVFVDDIVNDKINRAVVTSICEVARSLDRKVVAEGVEDRLTVNMLTALGVDYGQGYVWAKPRPLSDILQSGDVQQKARADEEKYGPRKPSSTES